jgi:hypothetical protein
MVAATTMHPPLPLLVQVPVVATEPRVKFLRGLPKVGSYCAVAVPAGPAGPSAGTFQAVLAADSLLPEGSGAALSGGDVMVLWDIAQALGKALDAAAAMKRCADTVPACTHALRCLLDRGKHRHVKSGTDCRSMSPPTAAAWCSASIPTLAPLGRLLSLSRPLLPAGLRLHGVVVLSWWQSSQQACSS